MQDKGAMCMHSRVIRESQGAPSLVQGWSYPLPQHCFAAGKLCVTEHHRLSISQWRPGLPPLSWTSSGPPPALEPVKLTSNRPWFRAQKAQGAGNGESQVHFTHKEQGP